MGLIRDTNDISPVGEKIRILGEFVNGSEKHPSAVSTLEKFL